MFLGPKHHEFDSGFREKFSTKIENEEDGGFKG